MERTPNVPAPLFDRDLLRARALRARRGPARDAWLLPRLAEDLRDRVEGVLRDFPVAVDLGTPSEAAAQALRTLPRVGRVFRADRAAGLEPRGDVAAGMDALPFRDGALSLVTSVWALHWAEDLPGTLVQMRRALRPDGLFVAALPGAGTLTELRQAFAEAEAETAGGASPRVIPFADIRDLGALLQRAGFALPVVDADRLTVRYRDLMDLARDIRALGAANPMLARSRRPLRRATLARLDRIYRERFADADGRLRATLEIVWLSGWAPHASQQQPLRPGSARARLADALGATESGTGVKPG